MSNRYGFIKAYYMLAENIEKRGSKLQGIFRLAKLLRSRPATALLYFISRCIEDDECLEELSMLERKYSRLLIDIVIERTRKILEAE